jgi:hypothetical protein
VFTHCSDSAGSKLTLVRSASSSEFCGGHIVRNRERKTKPELLDS